MNLLSRFSVFLALIALGFYAGNINSSLLGIDLTSASAEVVNLFKISFWAAGLGVLYKMSGVFN